MLRANDTVMARAFVSGMIDSDVAQATYIIISSNQGLSLGNTLALLGFGLLVAVVCIAVYSLRKRKNKNKSYEVNQDDGTVNFGDGEKGARPPF